MRLPCDFYCGGGCDAEEGDARQNKEVGATGLEPVKDSCRNTHVSLLSGNKCDAYLNDPDLSAVVNAWSKLPSALKAGIVAMVRAAGDAK